MENREIARLLSETADLMEIAAEDGFRIRSYRNAAGVIEGYPERLADIACNPDRKLTEVPGIGKGIAGIICDILEKGSFDKRDQLLEKYPPTALELLKIQGLGPKSIALLIEHFRVSTIDDLERLCTEQKLRTLPRMGAKLEEKVLRSIQQYRSSAGRFLLPFARRMADELIEYLSTTPGVEKVTAAGSLRRGRETVGDLDLLVTGPDPSPALDRFVQFPRVHEVLGRGGNKASAKVGLEGIQVDVRALPVESFGAAMQYFTGSKDHNVALRQRALRMGLTLNEYGLFRLETNERIASERKKKCMPHWTSPGFLRSCGRIAEKSKPRRNAGCRCLCRPLTFEATSTCIRKRRMVAQLLKRWPPRRDRSVMNMLRLRIIRRRWQWRTDWMKPELSRLPKRYEAGTKMVCRFGYSPALSATS